MDDIGFGCLIEKTNISELCRSRSCAMDIDVLDLSHNFIQTIPRTFERTFNELKHFNLSQNRVQIIESGAFTNMTKLETIILSDNKLKEVPIDVFQNLPNLTTLDISNNRLSLLKSNTLMGTDVLEHIDLQNNRLSSEALENGILHNHSNLVTLNLDRNQLTYFTGSTLRGSNNLNKLYLRENKISRIGSSIGEGSFQNFPKLMTLSLKSNNLEFISDKTLSGPLELADLDISNNKISHISGSAFKTLHQLKKINLSVNYLEAIPQSLQNLSEVFLLDLHGNRINKLDVGSFSGMHKLQGLSLKRNFILHIPRFVFTNRQLYLLHLESNRIQTIEPGAFDELKSMNVLVLSKNNITKISALFDRLVSLRDLRMSHNNIQHIEQRMFPHRLESIDLSYNKITTIGYQTFYVMPYLKKVNLKVNQLRKISDIFNLRLSPNNQPSTLPKHTEFYLSVNNWQCDCHLPGLLQLKATLSGGLFRYPVIADFKHMFCFDVLTTKVRWLTDIEINDSRLLCNYTEYCTIRAINPSCSCCENRDYRENCHCFWKCPENCTCYHNKARSIEHIVCNNTGLMRFPQTHINATAIDLVGNNIHQLTKMDLYHHWHLVTLNMQRCGLKQIEDFTFKNAVKLKKLFLDQNDLVSLNPNTFSGLVSLEELYLANNTIEFIANDTFFNLVKLKIFTINGNRLKVLLYQTLEMLPNLMSIHLAQNPYTCNCSYALDFKLWLFKQDSIVLDQNVVYCRFYNLQNASVIIIKENGSFYPLTVNPNRINIIDGHTIANTQDIPLRNKLSGYDLDFYCNNLTQSIAESTMIQTMTDNTYTVALSSVIAIFVVIVIVGLLLFNYRDIVKVWLYSKYGWRFCSNSDDENEKEYDAFISYSSRDDNWVHHTLVPKLESGQAKYKVCVHHRDFPVGASIAETIVETVQNSRRTIMLLSNNYLDSEWCTYEFKTAHHQVLKDRKNRLIVIIFGKVSPEKLDPDLKLYLKTNTYLEWRDPWFWEKLYYAMPNVSHDNKHSPTEGENFSQRVQSDSVGAYPSGSHELPDIMTTHL